MTAGFVLKNRPGVSGGAVVDMGERKVSALVSGGWRPKGWRPEGDLLACTAAVPTALIVRDIARRMTRPRTAGGIHAGDQPLVRAWLACRWCSGRSPTTCCW